jgi:hypothetical protein
MKRHLKTVVLALVLAAAFGAGLTASAGHKPDPTCWTICCDGGFPCISCCKGQACPDLICP